MRRDGRAAHATAITAGRSFSVPARVLVPTVALLALTLTVLALTLTTHAVAASDHDVPLHDDPLLALPDEPDGAEPTQGTMRALSTSQWWLDAVNAPPAWSTGTGADVTVAILDTALDPADAGVEPSRVLDPIDIVEDEEPARHGTAAAALAVGETASACPDCMLLPVTVLSADGHSPASNVAAGIDAAVAAGADVISLSLGGDRGSRRLEQAVNDALNAGVTVIAAAGNNGSAERFYPAAYEGVISVAGHDQHEERYTWSNHGDWVTAAAPGCGYVAGLDGSWFCGTSAATPIAAGVAALAVETSPDAAPDEVRAAIAASGVQLDWVSGGTVDAVVARGELRDDPPEPSITTLPSEPVDAAVALSESRFAEGEAESAVIARDDLFADALAGSALAGAYPVLYVEDDGVPEATRTELERVLADDAVVYLLGGDQAVSPEVAEEFEDVAAEVIRLAGADRIGTALAIAERAVALAAATGDDLEEVGEDAPPVFLARSDEWADAIAIAGPAAAQGAPVLLTPGDELDPRVADALAEFAPRPVVLLGGEAALTSEVAEAVHDATDSTPSRLAGVDRGATSAVIAAELVGDSSGGAVIVNGYGQHSWAAGLAAAPLAARDALPILLTDAAGELGDEAVETLTVSSASEGSEAALWVDGTLSQEALETLRTRLLP